MRDFREVWKLFDPLYDDLLDRNQFFQIRPLLAHYTTMFAFEQIVKNNEFWFGNPLFMNDLEEVRFGINEGTRLLVESPEIARAMGPAVHDAFVRELLAARENFETKHAFDTYILCLSQHNLDDGDGLLSMWRGYGDAGKGVAIVLDGGTLAETEETPLIIAKVEYATTERRLGWFGGLGKSFADIVMREGLSADEIPAAAWALFARLRLFSLFTKHVGFSEEQEWRLAYLPERDTDGVFKKYLGYFNGPRGVEPKLKLPIEPMEGVGNQPFSLELLVKAIILGPSASSRLSVLSSQRMLEKLGRVELAKRVQASRIPYRPT